MNKINWKYLATTPGYKSLKTAYIHDLQKGWPNKKELYKKFRWVIDRAKHHAYYKGISISTILNFWENNRDYWWLTFYQDSNQPKIHSNSKKNSGIKGIRKYYKATHWNTPQERKHRMCKLIQEKQQKESTKQKKRWTPYQREHRRL